MDTNNLGKAIVTGTTFFLLLTPALKYSIKLNSFGMIFSNVSLRTGASFLKKNGMHRSLKMVICNDL